MLTITCDKCRRRFALSTEQIQTNLADNAGKKHVQVMCAHCGRGNKVDPRRLRQALRFARPAAESPAAEDPAAEDAAAEDAAAEDAAANHAVAES